MKNNLSKIAHETVEITNNCYYIDTYGQKIYIDREMSFCCSHTKLYESEELSEIQSYYADKIACISVMNETVLSGAKSLFNTSRKVGVLNFASATSPGGGFLEGAVAQEESLARSSGLYSSLLSESNNDYFYEFHKNKKDHLYSHKMIYSPKCPVFRNDEGELLSDPYWVDILTSPAPNVNRITNKEDIDSIPFIVRSRINKILSLFAFNHCDSIVLGAWGCGVFGNDPVIIANAFKDCIPAYLSVFKNIRFSVLDQTSEKSKYNTFVDVFEG